MGIQLAAVYNIAAMVFARKDFQLRIRKALGDKLCMGSFDNIVLACKHKHGNPDACKPCGRDIGFFYHQPVQRAFGFFVMLPGFAQE